MVIYSFYIFDRHSKLTRPLALSPIEHLPTPEQKSLLTPLYPTAECIYSKTWLPPPSAPGAGIQQQQHDGPTNISAGAGSANSTDPHHNPMRSARSAVSAANKASDDAKLIFGTVFSLRNMVRKLGGEDDAFISYRTAQYKLHYYETASNLRFVMLTDTGTLSMRNVMHQIYINLWCEYGESLHSFSGRAWLWLRLWLWMDRVGVRKGRQNIGG